LIALDEEKVRNDFLLKSLLGQTFSSFIITTKQKIENRREYLKEVRYADSITNQRGTLAATNSFQDLIYNSEQFVEYVKTNHYPFKSSFYKTKIGATSELDFAFTCAESDFEYFLEFVKQEYGMNFGTQNSQLDDRLAETNNLAGTMS